MSFDSVAEELTDQKKQSVLEELNQHLCGKVVVKVELDPVPGKLAPLIKLTFGDGTTLDASMCGGPGCDSEWYNFFLVNVNGKKMLRL